MDIILDKTHPWDRQAEEPETAYLAFLIFRDGAYPQGAGGPFQPRTIKETAESIGYSPATVHVWARTFAWTVRAGEYDRWLQAQKHGEAEGIAQAAKVRRDHQRLLAKAFQWAESELDKRIQLSDQMEVPSATPRELNQMMDFIIRHQRLLAGEHTDHVRLEGEWDLEALDLEDLEKLEEIRKLATGEG